MFNLFLRINYILTAANIQKPKNIDLIALDLQRRVLKKDQLDIRDEIKRSEIAYDLLYHDLLAKIDTFRETKTFFDDQSKYCSDLDKSSPFYYSACVAKLRHKNKYYALKKEIISLLKKLAEIRTDINEVNEKHQINEVKVQEVTMAIIEVGNKR